MSAFRPGLPASQVHDRLQTALTELQAAERNAVLWFAEIHRRRLYRQLGYSSTHQYAAEALGFSRSKTAQFIRLAEALKGLPRLRRSIASGEVPWTKARVVASVATARTENRWIQEARTHGRRKLEAKVADLRRRARGGAGRDAAAAGQATLAIETDPVTEGGVGAGAVDPATSGTGGACADTNRGRPPITEAEIPVTITLTFSPERYACYRALLEKLRKLGVRDGREDLLLAGLESVLAARLGDTDTRVHTEPAAQTDTRVHTAGDGDLAVAVNRQAQTDTRVHTEPAAQADTRVQAAGDGDLAVAENRPTRTDTRVHTEPADTGEARGAPAAAARRISGVSPYQVIVRVCESCGLGAVPTDRGEKSLSASTLAAILCDARIKRPGKPNRAAVPPALRREAMARDGYRCRSAGCAHTSFLNVHHIVPREVGGANVLPNLITLCSGCHAVLHRPAARLVSARAVGLSRSPEPRGPQDTP